MRIYNSLGCLIKTLLTFNSNRIRGKNNSDAPSLSRVWEHPPRPRNSWLKNILLRVYLYTPLILLQIKYTAMNNHSGDGPVSTPEILINADNSIII